MNVADFILAGTFAGGDGGGGGGQIIQYETVPTASSIRENQIIQYIGTTDATYTNGYFYKCIGTTVGETTTYSWSNIDVETTLKNKATGNYSVTIEGTATTRNGATNVGVGSVADGYRASSYGNNANAAAQEAVAIGFNSNATAQGAIQLGSGTNNNANTLQFGNYQLLDNTGKIPSDRLPVYDGSVT